MINNCFTALLTDANFSALYASAWQAVTSFHNSFSGRAIEFTAVVLSEIIAIVWLHLRDIEKTHKQAEKLIASLVERIGDCQSKIRPIDAGTINLAQEQFAEVLRSLNQAEANLAGRPGIAKQSAEDGLRQLQHVYRFLSLSEPGTLG